VRRIVVRGPNHLGDGVMALPALEALCRLGDVVVHAPRWGPVLYRHLPVRVVPRGQLVDGDVAVLLAPSLRAAWEARRLPRVVGTPTDGRGWLLTDRVAAAEHTADTYARLVQRVGATVIGEPRYPLAEDDPVPEVPEGHLALNPLSATGAVRQWGPWASLAVRRGEPVVFYGGPGEERALLDVARGLPMMVGLELPALGRALGRARMLVSADTGPAHFARAVGVPTVVVYGSTSPRRSGPSGAHAVEGDAPCRPCHRSRCRVGTLACLDIDVDRVLAGMEAVDA